MDINKGYDPVKVKAIREALGFSQSELAKHLNIKQPSVAAIEKGVRAKLGIHQLEVLVKKFNINPLYLISDDKNIFIDDSYNDVVSEPSSIYRTLNDCFLVPVAAQAGYANNWPDGAPRLPTVVIPGMNYPNARVFEIAGDSMEPLLMDGDYVACTKVEESSHIRDGLIYVVVSKSQGITIKYVHVKPNRLECYPENITQHQPFHIDTDDVKEIWEVRIRITKQIANGRFKTSSLSNGRVDRLEKIVEKMLEHPNFNPD